MILQITEREREGIVILDLEGPIVLGEQDASLRERLLLLHQTGKANIALNMRNVSKIDSTGLGTLVVALVKLQKAGGRLALFNLHSSHMDLLLFTKLVTVFELFGDEQDAVNGCFPSRAMQRYDILSFVQQQAPVADPVGDDGKPLLVT